MEYADQLKTSAWMRKKYEILERDSYVCSKCLKDNFEEQLEVHHIAYYPNRKAWEYPDYMLVTLCRSCHQEEHDKGNTTKKKSIINWITKLLLPKSNKNTNAKF